jgi:hypothetical protein
VLIIPWSGCDFPTECAVEPSGSIRYRKYGILHGGSADFVTSETKIRELCTMLLASQNDEAANRILPELKDAIHEHCERVRAKVAREYPFHKDVAAG